MGGMRAALRRRRMPTLSSSTTLAPSSSPSYYLSQGASPLAALSSTSLRFRTSGAFPNATISSNFEHLGNLLSLNSNSINSIQNINLLHRCQTRRYKSVFVSRHNQNVLSNGRPSILEYLESQGLAHPGDHRTTATHVILKECPFCTKPTNDKASNQHKLYIQNTTGAYFCHRCGQGGSWFDFKRQVGGDPNHQVVSALGETTDTTGNTNKSVAAAAGRRPSGGTSGVATLPLPSPRLQALYSTQLLDQPQGKEVLDYLVTERGLSKKTLRKYGVGRAQYSFLNDQNEWTDAECVTFPWLLTPDEIQFQESLRGVQFDGTSNNSDDSKSSAASAPKQSRKQKSKAKDSDSDDKSAAVAATPMTWQTRRIKARAIHEKSQQRLDPAGGGWGLFGWHTVPNDDKTMPQTVVLTEGEYDCLSVWQATGMPAVSLPNGCRSLPPEVLPLLEEIPDIVLWMDNDGPGQEGAQIFAKKIGLERCRIVQPQRVHLPQSDETDDTTNSKDLQLPKDANDALRMGCELQALIDDARPVPHDRILQFDDLRESVLHQVMNPDQYAGTPLPSLPALTNIIQGLRRGELTVLTGPTGSGKTTFLGQVSLDLVEQGVRTLWGSFEIQNTRLIHKLLQQYCREPVTAELQQLEAMADKFSALPFYFLKFHGGSDIDDVLDAMEYAVYVNDVEHIILDNLQFMTSRKDIQNRTFDKYDVQDVAIEKFRKFATEKNVHISLVVHPRKEAEDSKLTISSIYGSAKATQEADTVMILQTDGGRRKYVDVKKNRFNGQLGTAPLYFDSRSNRYTNQQVQQQQQQQQQQQGRNNWNAASSDDYSAGSSVTIRPVEGTDGQPKQEQQQADASCLLMPDQVKSM